MGGISKVKKIFVVAVALAAFAGVSGATTLLATPGVPEPGATALIGTGLLVLGLLVRRK
jgi:hypothetical protein